MVIGGVLYCCTAVERRQPTRSHRSNGSRVQLTVFICTAVTCSSQRGPRRVEIHEKMTPQGRRSVLFFHFADIFSLVLLCNGLSPILDQIRSVLGVDEGTRKQEVTLQVQQAAAALEQVRAVADAGARRVNEAQAHLRQVCWRRCWRANVPAAPAVRVGVGVWYGVVCWWLLCVCFFFCLFSVVCASSSIIAPF